MPCVSVGQLSGRVFCILDDKIHAHSWQSSPGFDTQARFCYVASHMTQVQLYALHRGTKDNGMYYTVARYQILLALRSCCAA